MSSYNVSIDNLDGYSVDDSRSQNENAIKKQLSSEILDKGPAIGQYSHVSKSLQLTLLRQVASSN